MKFRAIALLLVAGIASVWAADTPAIDAKLEADIDRAIARGTEWLIANQNENGSYGKYPHPAIAALAISAMAHVEGVDPTKRDAAIDRALAYMLSFRQEDGAIYPADRDMKDSANYPNYTTSIALLALNDLRRDELVPVMKAARAYLMASQFQDQDSVDYGGVGYGKTGRADLSNGSWAAEALHKTEWLTREPHSNDPQDAQAAADMWTKMQVFLTKCQNLPETNPEAYVSDHAEDLGGMIYRPNESKAGSRDGEAEVSNLISSGSMTYAGLKSMIYAKLDRKDVRVKGAMDYLMRHWTLDENPGMGGQGLYYYYNVMAKALDVYGMDTLTLANGDTHNWREELAARVLAEQKEDGRWQNDNGRFMESLPELSTPYLVTTLKVIRHGQSPALSAD